MIVIPRQEDDYDIQMSIVSSLLDIDQSPNADLLSMTERQHHGSCLWLTNNESFQEWLQSSHEAVPIKAKWKADPSFGRRILWLTGRPGTGKSVCAGHVINYLVACKVRCSFYFFNDSDKEHSPVAALLRSLAFQMAASSSQARQMLLAMARNNERVSKDDHNMIWSSIFLGKLFRADFSQTPVWVIDALDECSHKGLATLVHMLSKIDDRTVLRIFITSRPEGLVGRLFRQYETPLLELQIQTEDSIKDIEPFIKSKWPHAENQYLVSEVLTKSNGIFLWASLIMAKMETTYSVEDIERLLHQLPSEMNEFYSKIVETLASSPSAEIAKCILKWVICSPRPLTTREIKEIVRFDINRTLAISDDQLEAICGHLVIVDKRTSRIQVLHQTITTYLIQDREKITLDSQTDPSSSFRLIRSEVHARASELCLIYLNGKGFSPPKFRRVIASGNKSEESPFSGYSHTNFSYHLARCSSTAEVPLGLLNKFLKTNILSWIERSAREESLSLLIETAENLKSYLERLATRCPPIDAEMQLVEAWINDLIHVAVSFGPNLLDSPSAVHFLVPLLCPSGSVIHKQFARTSKLLQVVGSFEQDWDDRLSCFIYPTEALAVAICSQFLAVGLANGEVIVYTSDNFEIVATLSHGQQVRQLKFGKLTSILASCSPRQLKVWDRRYTCLWTIALDSIPLDLAFNSDDSMMFLPSRESSIMVVYTADGSREDDMLLRSSDDSDSSDGELQTGNWTPPTLTRVCPDQQLAALLYRDSRVSIWDIARCEKIGIFEKKGCEDIYGSPQALDAIFNPLPDLELLAIAYKDGDLITCNPWTLQQVCIYEISVQILAASPDGRTLATGDNLGVIHLFFFQTLRPICKISALEDRVMGIVFTSDNLRFFDIRANACNVWEPSALVSKGGSDHSSFELLSEELLPQYLPTVSARMLEDAQVITTMAHTARGDYLFCGRNDGSVSIFEVATGVVVKTLTYHAKGVSINHLDWHDEQSVLLSVDLSSRFMLARLAIPRGTEAAWDQVSIQVDARASESISQALIAPDGSKILVSTENEDQVREAAGGRLLWSERLVGPKKWVSHPMILSQLILINGNSLHVYDWGSLLALTSSHGITMLIRGQGAEVRSSGSWYTNFGSQSLAMVLRNATETQGPVALVDSSEVSPNERTVMVDVLDKRLKSILKYAIGFLKSSFFFLDAKGWVCSLSTKSSKTAQFYTRHFFIPRKWQFGSKLLIRIVSRTSIAFAYGENLTVFHGFLDLEEKVFLRDAERKI